MNDGFVYVDALVPDLRPDAEYATWDDFTGEPVDGYLANRIVGTRALCAAREQARDVATRSGHSRGSTVDLALYHLATGELVPMGGGHDLMDPISSHRAREISPVEAENREDLHSIMDACGFDRYDCEWWHHTLRDESHPDVYFDFPIT